MLEYSKSILEKVSFDQALFNKELKKALRLLDEHEQKELMAWCQANFAQTEEPIMNSL